VSEDEGRPPDEETDPDIPPPPDNGKREVDRHDDLLTDLCDRDHPLGLRDRLRYDHARKRWHFWDRHRWRPDGSGRVYELLRGRLNSWFGASQSEIILKELGALLNLPKKKTVLESFSYRRTVALEGDEWDRDPYLLGAPNGLIDLRTGGLVTDPHPEWMVSRSVRVDYNPYSNPADDCPMFLTFLDEITAGNRDLVRYLLRIFGYALFGLQTEQKFWIFTGQGNNGKGVLLKLVAHVLGDYAATPSSALYMRSKRGVESSANARTDLMTLQGIRFTPMSEPPGGEFNDEMLKAHTGDDPIRARALYSNNEIEFRPTHTIVIATNQPPKVEDVGKSMQRRVRVVHFTETFDGERMDRDLETKLRTESVGILALLVKSAGIWFTDGLDEPVIVSSASQAYIEDNDPLSEFVYACCVLDQRASTPAKLLFDAYSDWAARSGGDLMSATGFGTAISRRFRRTKTMTANVYLGLRLKNAVELAEHELLA
jgi:putative DNA primase/helicase